MLETANIERLEGCELVGAEDERIGTIDAVHLDDDTKAPELRW
jgi:hypothetical protein